MRSRPRAAEPAGPIDTIYGRFTAASKRRLDLTFDYEAAEIAGFRRVAELLQPTLLLDIGANVGVYAVHLAGVASLTRILAFEPAPDTFGQLQRNLALQEDARLQAVNEALSDRAGRARFAVFGALAGNNAIRDTAVSVRTPETTIEVPTARLDDRVAVAGETFLAKIDVEGHELKVLAGAPRLLADNRGVLQIESFRPVAELDAALAAAGYARIFRMKDDYYYTNLAEPERRSAIQDILFAEVATALGDLRDERRRRRAAIRAARALVEQLRYGADPVIGTP
jgi:FkbM family methyltransferase